MTAALTDRYDLARLVPALRQHLLAKGVAPPGWRDDDARTAQTYQAEVLEALVRLDGALRAQGLAVAPDDQPAVAAACAGWLMGLGVLEPLLHQEGVQEVIVRGHHVFVVHDDGRVESLGPRADDAYFQDLAQRVADNTVQPGARPLSGAWTIVVTDLPRHRSRFTAILPPTSVAGPAINIRRFTMAVPELTELVQRGAMSEGVALFLLEVVGRLNLYIVGRSGAGKTTLLNALAGHYPSDALVLVVETFRELQPGLAHPVRAVAPAESTAGHVTVSDIVNVGFTRMMPQGILVGEVVGPEAVELLEAMATGARVMATGHGDSVLGGLFRLERLILRHSPAGAQRLVVREDLAESLHLVAFLG
ncbi:MAG: Flp pilus assembly complex ATPase component TadA, partial [Chloroflexi bacterium]|nr:Flp pilus assembly complex ATPase component TadA [Chloroflexota bacterium]